MATRSKLLTKPAAAKTSYVRVRIQPKLKRNAEGILQKIGLSISDAVTILFKQVVAQKGLPIELGTPNRDPPKALR